MRRIIVLMCVLGVAAWVVPSAFSWYSDISATMDCSGTVTWTASAWPGPTPASRENPDVRVWVSYDGGASYTQVGSGQFDAANSYSFSGSFSAGSATSALLKVHEEANWPGDGGDTPGPPHYATVTRPTDCSQVTETPPVVPQPPGRAGYCDDHGVFWDLVAGQETESPYNQMHLRPADVDQSGAIYCAAPTPPVLIDKSPPPPPAEQAVSAVAPKHVVPKVKKHVVKKHVVRHRGALPAARGRTLPFTP